MPLTTADFRTMTPDFEEIEIGERISVNDTDYTVSNKETRSPSPGEIVYYLYLREDGEVYVISWGSEHRVESLWIRSEGSDPMTDGAKVSEVDYHGSVSGR